MELVAMNDFAKRQTADSPFTHFEGSWYELVRMVNIYLCDLLEVAEEEGWDTSGVIKVQILDDDHLAMFRTPVQFADTVMKLELVAKYERRREGEYKHLSIVGKGAKALCRSVEVICYPNSMLGEDASTSAEYEIVSINGSPNIEPTPMDPVAMARNFLEMPGGTKAEYSAEQFAKAIWFWSQHVMVEPE